MGLYKEWLYPKLSSKTKDKKEKKKRKKKQNMRQELNNISVRIHVLGLLTMAIGVAEFFSNIFYIAPIFALTIVYLFYSTLLFVGIFCSPTFDCLLKCYQAKYKMRNSQNKVNEKNPQESKKAFKNKVSKPKESRWQTGKDRWNELANTEVFDQAPVRQPPQPRLDQLSILGILFEEQLTEEEFGSDGLPVTDTLRNATNDELTNMEIHELLSSISALLSQKRVPKPAGLIDPSKDEVPEGVPSLPPPKYLESIFEKLRA